MQSTASKSETKASLKDEHKAEDDKTARTDKSPRDDKAAQADKKTDNKAAQPAQKIDKSEKTEAADEKPAAKTDDAAADAASMTMEAQPPQPEVAPAPQTILGAAQPAAEDGEEDGDAAAPVGAAAAPAQPAPAPQAADKAPEQVAEAAAAPKPEAPKTDAAKPAKPGQPKILEAKAPKSDDKAQAPLADAAQVKAAEPQFTANDNAAPKTAPANHDTVAALAAPQGAQAKAPDAPVLAQHVQVTHEAHQPTPNLPALAVQIAAKTAGGSRQFDIRLDPPELGHVQVRLSIDAAGKTSAHLTAEQPQTLELLQKDAPALTRALREAGLEVAQDGLNFSLRQQAGESGSHDPQSGRRGRANTLSVNTSLAASPTSAPVWRGMGDGRLDIRV